MAMAGQAQLDRIGTSVRPAQDVVAWRQLLKYVYYWCIFAAGAALVVLVHPSFVFSVPFEISAGIIAVFLLINERPQPAYQSPGYAPLAAVLAAATATLGWWALPLAVTGWSAVHWRLREPGKPLGPYLTSFAAQIGMAVLATYAMVNVFGLTTALAARAPHVLGPFILFVGIIGVGMTWQTVNNGLVIGGFMIVGKPASFVRYWRAGFVASLWAYLLAGMYAFGGIFAAAVFYIVVAHTRMFDRIVKAMETRDERDFIATQFHEMVRDFIELLSPDDSTFAGDVRYLSMQLARKVGLPKVEIENIGWAAEFHEIGKCKLPAAIRSGIDLTPAQEQERLRYPMLGAKVLRKAPKLIPEEVAYAVEHQCEAFDGTGYPHGMKGERIPVSSRIIAISRDYLQLITGHGSGQTRGKQAALEVLRSRVGNQYDPALVDLLCREIA
jgi:hypothetical protein